jgi:hypothetical protein
MSAANESDMQIQDVESCPYSRLLRYSIRLILISGFVPLAIGTLYSLTLAAPGWYAWPVFTSCLFVGFALCIFWGSAEFLMRIPIGTSWLVWILLTTIAAVLSPWFYVLPAAVYGSDVGEFDTWHLLPLFAVMHMVQALVFFGTCAAVVILVITFLWFLWKRFVSQGK